jgi:hypothetical protein
MRILLTLAMGSIFLLAASAAIGEDFRDPQHQTTILRENLLNTGHAGHAALQLSPIYVEIQLVLDTARETESQLLAELAGATEEEEVDRIVRRIQRLETDRDLAILKIQARYAHMDGRWDLEYQLRSQIIALLESDIYRAD